jgi:hypothetical protein
MVPKIVFIARWRPAVGRRFGLDTLERQHRRALFFGERGGYRMKPFRLLLLGPSRQADQFALKAQIGKGFFPLSEVVLGELDDPRGKGVGTFPRNIFARIAGGISVVVVYLKKSFGILILPFPSSSFILPLPPPSSICEPSSDFGGTAPSSTRLNSDFGGISPPSTTLGSDIGATAPCSTRLSSDFGRARPFSTPPGSVLAAARPTHVRNSGGTTNRLLGFRGRWYLQKLRMAPN